MNIPRKLEWEDLEHEHQEKHPDWFWIVSIIAITIAVVSILVGNILFALLILLGAFTVLMHARKEPRVIRFELNARGIVIDDTLFPYLNLDSFWINDIENKILLKSKKILMPYIIVPLGDTHPEDVRDFLLQYISEEEHHEPILQKFFEWLGL